ncbi:MAG: SsrA-binding protein SmpB [Acholeplasmataceae bacterium]|jgi:SsrA-binding protein|nr:SsrA-binding protein SmpB [Acholeplasmataceae bacterium]MDD2260507.1 SsrA-binding protein SmpB [Acholeplasmataceae bacterium]MDD4203979.1 SsrA-binding protein SmpB [Acholeplasmataceae bacterium]MDD4468771.1 SsrA-binding protein SmpB [Acholeplasmataceae bacterium]
MKIVAQNKKARHEYFIENTYEAGIQLKGTEIKSVRAGKVSLDESYVDIKNGEIFIVGMHISPYLASGSFNHDETRDRKLLMHKNEIIKLLNKKERDGFTLIPLKLYFEGALVKVEVAVAKGKKLYDKRESLKEEDVKKRLRKQGIK